MAIKVDVEDNLAELTGQNSRNPAFKTTDRSTSQEYIRGARNYGDMSKSRTTVGELETIRRSNIHTSRVFNFETVNFNSGNAIKVKNLFLENYVHSDEKKSSKHLTRVVSFNPQKGKISRTDT